MGAIALSFPVAPIAPMGRSYGHVDTGASTTSGTPVARVVRRKLRLPFPRDSPT